jgi:hypothetical protein
MLLANKSEQYTVLWQWRQFSTQTNHDPRKWQQMRHGIWGKTPSQ